MEVAGGRTTLLALQDASVHAPLGMYLHLRWVPLSRGPRPLLTGNSYASYLLCPIVSTATCCMRRSLLRYLQAPRFVSRSRHSAAHRKLPRAARAQELRPAAAAAAGRGDGAGVRQRWASNGAVGAAAAVPAGAGACLPLMLLAVYRSALPESGPAFAVPTCSDTSVPAVQQLPLGCLVKHALCGKLG